MPSYPKSSEESRETTVLSGLWGVVSGIGVEGGGDAMMMYGCVGIERHEGIMG